MSKLDYTMTVHNFFARGMKLVPVDKDKIPAEWTQSNGKKTKSWKIDIPESAILDHKGWIALIAGKRSGGVECIDVDLKYDLTGDLWDRYKKEIKKFNKSLFDGLVIQETQNKGIHIIYRCSNFEGNLKLAGRETNEVERFQNSNERRKVLIETRGEGGYFLVPPSKGYKVIQGDIFSLPMLSNADRDKLIEIARSFDLIPKKEPAPKKPTKVATTQSSGQGYGSSLKPGEDYANRGDIIALLERHGWNNAFESKGQAYLKRPGLTKSKYGATYSHEKRSFYVFTSSSEFEQNESYSPMGVYAVLECNGSYEEAARRLGQEGYGDSDNSTRKSKPAKKPAPPKAASEYMFDINDGDDLLYATSSGSIPLGLKFGIRSLDKYLRYKKNQYLLIVGNQNVGKTFFVLFLLVRLAIEHGKRFLILVMENDVGQAKRDLAQFYNEQIIKKGTEDSVVKKGLEFVNKHFRFLHTTKFRFDHIEALNAGRAIFKEWEYDGFFIDPYNALKINLSGSGVSGYEYHLEASNEIQFFSKSVCSVILSCHITSEAARRGTMPRLDDVQGGMSFTAKAHDGVVLFRDMSEAELKYITEVVVSKIKDRQTGGDWTDHGYPVRLKLVIQPKFGFVEEGSIDWKLSEGVNLDAVIPVENEDNLEEVEGAAPF